MVSSGPHTLPEKEDPADKGTEYKGISGREGERLVLQRYPTDDPN
jgi:hypothetical protein